MVRLLFKTTMPRKLISFEIRNPMKNFKQSPKKKKKKKINQKYHVNKSIIQRTPRFVCGKPFLLKEKKHKTNSNEFTIVKSVTISSQFYV